MAREWFDELRIVWVEVYSLEGLAWTKDVYGKFGELRTPCASSNLLNVKCKNCTSCAKICTLCIWPLWEFPFYFILIICFIFPFFMFLCSFMPFVFFYLFVVDEGVSLAPTYSQFVMRKSNLCSSLRTKCWLSCFYLF